jgi:enamine deaminase RidA (YjgF/YER057c/UK114 family)
MKVYSHDAESLTVTCNQSIDMMLNAALGNRIIDKETFQKLVRMRVVVTDRKDLFSSMFNYLMGHKDELHIRVIGVQDRPEET